MAEFKIIHDDCIEAMRAMPENSIDSVVTDPPYGLKFMGKQWDHGVPGVPFWAEALRVAKPGAHLLAFGGTRTFHRLACAIEDAGWEIRDCIMWVYGSGFPKSLDVSKAIDKAAGAEREVIGQAKTRKGDSGTQTYAAFGAFRQSPCVDVAAPATDAARQWQGWGTALKPAWEPIIVARKPLDGTVAANVLKWGTGAINIDATRVVAGDEVGGEKPEYEATHANAVDGIGMGGGAWANTKGRWPANLIHSGEAEVVDCFPDTASAKKAGRGQGYGDGIFTNDCNYESTERGYDDAGGSASRFFQVCPLDDPNTDEHLRLFYKAKASKRDRDEGLGAFEEKTCGHMTGEYGGLALTGSGNASVTTRSNGHPTVKPTSLMAYLVRLITPPGGTVLDQFNGSGTTGKSALIQGFNYIGIEREPEYAAISEARCKHAVENAESLRRQYCDKKPDKVVKKKEEPPKQDGLF